MTWPLFEEPLRLVRGDQHLSSWSMRPWILMRQAKIPFEEIVIPLAQAETRQTILRHNPAGRVPALICGRRLIWDSLAICELIAELHPRLELWPKDLFARSVARAMVCEMHSGFSKLRSTLRFAAAERKSVSLDDPDLQAECDRIFEVWRHARESFGQGSGEFLFGSFSIADAFFAPVVSRFETYGVLPPDSVIESYMATIRALPSYQEWMQSAALELARRAQRS